ERLRGGLLHGRFAMTGARSYAGASRGKPNMGSARAAALCLRPLSRDCGDRSSGMVVARRAASAGAPSCLASFEVAAIVGRCLPGDPMKGSAERARALESHIDPNLT